MKLLKYVLLVLFLFSTASATEKNATVTKVAEYSDATVYSFTTSTNISVNDTIEISAPGGQAFWLAGTGTEGITITVASSEATVDSIRLAVVWQVSGDKTATNTNTYGDLDWVVAEVDSANNASVRTNMHTFAQATVAPSATRFRVFIAEIFGATLKDANQTLTGYLFVPKPPTNK